MIGTILEVFEMGELLPCKIRQMLCVLQNLTLQLWLCIDYGPSKYVCVVAHWFVERKRNIEQALQCLKRFDWSLAEG